MVSFGLKESSQGLTFFSSSQSGKQHILDRSKIFFMDVTVVVVQPSERKISIFILVWKMHGDHGDS